MKESCWKRGSKKDAEKIEQAFRDLGACTCADYTREDMLYVLDGICGTLFMLPYESQTSEAIMDSHMFNELTLKVEPTFDVGDWVVFNNSHNSIYQISEISDSYYMLTHTHGGSMPLSFSQGEILRPWTIDDAKDGDVLATDNGWTCIFQAFVDGYVFNSCCFMDSQKWFCESGSEVHTLDSRINGKIHPATKEQRDLLFVKMKEAGYQWDADKKELRKIQPHYDIKNFHVGMPVLVRADNNCRWDYSVFSRITGNESWQFAVCNGVSFTQCIPFEGNEHLLGTTDMCDKQYINW